MNKIKQFKYMPSLTKSELFSFMSTFQELKSTMDKKETENPDDNPDILSADAPQEIYLTASTKLSNQVSLLALSFNKRTPSPQSKYLNEQRELIRSSYRSIANVVKANLRFKTNSDYSDLLELWSLLRKYAKITQVNLKETTAYSDNLLIDIATDKYSGIVEKLSLSNWIGILSDATKKFKSDALKRSDTYEKTISYTYKMKQSILNDYHELEFCINSLAFNEKFKGYDEFVNSLNGVITDYIEILQRRNTSYKKHDTDKKPDENPDIL